MKGFKLACHSNAWPFTVLGPPFRQIVFCLILHRDLLVKVSNKTLAQTRKAINKCRVPILASLCDARVIKHYMGGLCSSCSSVDGLCSCCSWKCNTCFHRQAVLRWPLGTHRKVVLTLLPTGLIVPDGIRSYPKGIIVEQYQDSTSSGCIGYQTIQLVRS